MLTHPLTANPGCCVCCAVGTCDATCWLEIPDADNARAVAKADAGIWCCWTNGVFINDWDWAAAAYLKQKY